MAEDTGFEPADAFTSTVFKTAALNRSANPPYLMQFFAALFIIHIFFIFASILQKLFFIVYYFLMI